MKALHIHFGKDGGAERFFVNLAKALAERGVEQRFVIRPKRIWKPEIEPLGEIIEDHYRNFSISKYTTRWRVHRMVHEWQPQVIMAWMNRASQLIPADAPAIKLTRLGDYPRALKHYMRNDCMVSNVPGIAETLRELGWTKPIHVISNFPREVEPVAVDRATLDTPEDAFLVVSSGRFVPRKGFDAVMRAVAKIPGAWLWLVGDGQERENLEALARELGIAERVRFTGWVDEPIHYVAAGDVYCMASRHEPLGNVILESWQAGVPTVATRAEGPSWFVEDGRDALMVDIDDVEAMTAAILRLRDDKEFGAAIAKAGAEKLAARFSKKVIVDQYLDLFNGRL
ncbi:MAG: glycosyltransferase [Hyphomicrobiales bacterium]|nr:MAG: glycosyltransferase [Hyphomicrobiales bacterium]